MWELHISLKNDMSVYNFHIIFGDTLQQIKSPIIEVKSDWMLNAFSTGN